jgi:hypothetical protein
MRAILLSIALSIASLSLWAQDYVDLIKLSGNNTNMDNLENDYTTNINNYKAEIYLPVRISERLVVITGSTIENTRLRLTQTAERGNLWMTRLNLGIKYKHSDKWTGTYVILPKIASDFKSIGQQDFQFGGLALMSYQVAERWQLKFGLYVSSENHGSTVTPLLGIWHRSKNEKFYINAALPIRMDVNYALTKAFSVGADLLTSIKSYNLSRDNINAYVQEESIRLAGYLSYSFFDNAFIIRARAGLDLTDYGLYNSGDAIGAQILVFKVQGDNRNRLNPEFASAFYFGADLIYRFDLRKENQ